jgi:methyl-accepting chemotaxis protein
MKTWTIGKRLTAGFGVVLLGVVLLGLYSASTLMSLRADVTRIAHDSLPGTALSGKVLARVKDNYRLAIEHVNAPSDANRSEIEAAMQQVVSDIAQLLREYEKTITLEEDRAKFAAVGPAREIFLRTRDAVVSLSRRGRQEEARQALSRDLAPVYDSYLQKITAVSDWNIEAGRTVGAGIQEHVRFAVSSVTVGVLALLLVAVAIAWWAVRSANGVLRGAVGELQRGAEHVVSAAAQVASSAQSLSQGATEQAASLEESSASMEEMASMTRKNADNSERGVAMMTQTAQVIATANDALRDMLQSMSSIKESSDKVARIIKTIDEIAFQTNILALNAAVEAARAGEAGMGFAVVADEVRNLAQRSAQAAKDTAALIEESIANANQGQERVARVAAAIGHITESATAVRALIEEVSAASREQAQGIDQVSRAIAQMEQVTQTTAATAEESAAASEELSAQAEATSHVVSRIGALVDANAMPAAAATAPARLAAAGRPTAAATKPGAKPVKHAAAPHVIDPEEAIPLESTGTYGSF